MTGDDEAEAATARRAMGRVDEEGSCGCHAVPPPRDGEWQEMTEEESAAKEGCAKVAREYGETPLRALGERSMVIIRGLCSTWAFLAAGESVPGRSG